MSNRRIYHGGGYYNNWCFGTFDDLGEYFDQENPFFESDTTDKAISIRAYLNNQVLDGEFETILGMAGGATTNNAAKGCMYVGFTKNIAEEGDVTRISIDCKLDGTTANIAIGQNTDIDVGEFYNIIIQTTVGNTTEIFINGIQETLAWISGSDEGIWAGDLIIQTPLRSIIGSYLVNGIPSSAGAFDGYIDQMQYWTAALTSNQALELHGTFIKDPRRVTFKDLLASWYTIGDHIDDGKIFLSNKLNDEIRLGEQYDAHYSEVNIYNIHEL